MRLRVDIALACAAALSRLVGAGSPMIVRRTISVGFSSSQPARASVKTSAPP